MGKLSIEQMYKMVERGIIKKNTMLIVEGVSRHMQDEYMVDKMFKVPGSVKLNITRIDDGTEKFIDYKQIININGMDIDRILNAYDLGDNIIYEIKEKTDVENTVIGKNEAKIGNYVLEDGMRFKLINDNNSKYRDKILKVRFGKNGIQLVANRGRPKKEI